MKDKWIPKRGDRVKIYGSSIHGAVFNECIGVIAGRDPNFSEHFYDLIPNGCAGEYTFHIKQLRRLVKKKKSPRFECWVNFYSAESLQAHRSKEAADYAAASTRVRCIRMIQAKDQS